MANKILIPLQSLVSLNPLQTGAQQWVPRVSRRLYRALVAVAQAGGGSSVLNLLCAKDQANETVSAGQVFSRFSCRL